MNEKAETIAKTVGEVVQKADSGDIHAIVFGGILCGVLIALIRSNAPNVKKSIPVFTGTGLLFLFSFLKPDYEKIFIILGIIWMAVGSFIIYGLPAKKIRSQNAKKRLKKR
jgi:predicted branched-subunit amino acid permease